MRWLWHWWQSTALHYKLFGWRHVHVCPAWAFGCGCYQRSCSKHPLTELCSRHTTFEAAQLEWYSKAGWIQCPPTES
jgi:hypothetical protein